MAIFVGDPQVSLTISQGSNIFFLSEDMSVMCPSLLTNSVGLTVKELELIPNRSFSLKRAKNRQAENKILFPAQFPTLFHLQVKQRWELSREPGTIFYFQLVYF